jgi:hypothetical protein
MNYVRLCATIGRIVNFLYLSATQMFQAPNVIVLAIAATRLYRSVENRVGPQESLRSNKRTVISDMRVRSLPLNQTDISVPSTEYAQYLTSQSGSGSFISTEQERFKAHEVSLNVDVESGPEK